jgi:hypothetical protein
MVNYSNGKVYMIEPIVERLDDGDIYIGSSAKVYLSQRMDSHRQSYKEWKRGSRTSKTYSFELFDKYGVENCIITLLDSCPCNSRDELKARESHYVRSMKCVNKYIPGHTAIEWVAENKEHIAKYQKDYYLIHKERILLNSKKTFNCQCGSICQVIEKRRHQRSKKHLAYETNQDIGKQGESRDAIVV